MNTIKQRRGFTIIEVMIALVVLTVGVLGMVTTAAMVTRMIARGQRSASASAFAARRVERMRLAACIDLQRTNGQDTLYRGSQWVAINRWTFTDLGNLNYRLKNVSTYRTVKNKVRSDSTETTISCNTFL
ncbi:MAG TPA: prepilin-type N-terminal cleavage/methylation domain-containing protein [Gemmatimonadales bacterium]|nr:prepilin-type N-terminal cleavage/methylation domain-containing protein [Gemmatimonadales bacterium]